MNNLAAVLRSQGKYEEAEGMHRQVLELREKVLDQEHPSTLSSKDSLARCIAIDKNRVIADGTGQDVGDRIKDKESVLPEQKGRARSMS
jgi:hypothetical protein